MDPLYSIWWVHSLLHLSYSAQCRRFAKRLSKLARNLRSRYIFVHRRFRFAQQISMVRSWIFTNFKSIRSCLYNRNIRTVLFASGLIFVSANQIWFSDQRQWATHSKLYWHCNHRHFRQNCPAILSLRALSDQSRVRWACIWPVFVFSWN